MDRLDMALDDIIMHDRTEKKKTTQKTPQQQQQRKQQNNPAGGGDGGGGKARPSTNQSKNNKGSNTPYARPQKGNRGAKANGTWTHDLYQAGSAKTPLAGRVGLGGGTRIMGNLNGGLVTVHGGLVTAHGKGAAPRQQKKVPAVPKQPQQISIRGAAGPVTVVLSNLDATTSSDDIKMVVKKCGLVQKVILLYDGAGVATGTAEVVFSQREGAVNAVNMFDNVMADGRLLRCYIKPGAGDIAPAPVWAKSMQQQQQQQPQQQRVPTKPSAQKVYQPNPNPAGTGTMYSDRMNGNGKNGRKATTFSVIF